MTVCYQRPRWFLEGSDCESQTAYLLLLPPVEPHSTVSPGGGPPIHHLIEGLKVQQTHQIEPWKSCSPSHFAWKNTLIDIVFITTIYIFSDQNNDLINKLKRKGCLVTWLQWDKARNCTALQLQKMLKKTLFQSQLQLFGQLTYLWTGQGNKDTATVIFAGCSYKKKIPCTNVTSSFRNSNSFIRRTV